MSKAQTLNKMREICGAYLQRSVTAEQINKRGGVYRKAEVTSVIDEQNRTVEVAFSSEIEVDRWFGIEVLSHDLGAMRTDRLENGAPVLWMHNWEDQRGVVESVSIDADRRGRAVLRIGKSKLADELWQDILDGIVRHVSVGYKVIRVEVEERSGMPDLVTVIEWEPFEISFVSVPADPTVGIGRSMENAPDDQQSSSNNTDESLCNQKTREFSMNEKILRDAKGNLVRALVDENGNISKVIEIIEKAGDAERAASESERNRVRSIMDMAEKYGAEDLARDAVKSDTSVDDFQRQLLDHLNANRGKPLSDQNGADIGMTDKEIRDFSFIRALRALSNPTDRRAQEQASFEYEASRAAADKIKKEPQGILVPSDVLKRSLNTSTSGTATGDTGGYSISTNLMSQSFIEMLRNRAVLMQLGTTMGGLVGNILVPRQASGATGYWIGEDDDAPEDGLDLDQVGLSPKTVAALSEVTRKLLMQSSLDVEALIRSDLARALALTIDYAGFYGSGTANQPRGIANTSGINAVDFAGAASGGTGVLPTYAEVIDMESSISADNADINSMAYVMASGMRGHFKKTQQFSGTNGSPIWEPGNTVNGYSTQVTNQILPTDLFFGNFADLLIGMWGGLDLTVDPYTHSSKGRIRVVAMQDVDFILRRVESFCLGRDAS